MVIILSFELLLFILQDHVSAALAFAAGLSLDSEDFKNEMRLILLSFLFR